MSKIIMKLSMAIGLPICLIAILYQLDERPNVNDNGFLRSFITDQPKQISQQKIPVSLKSIVGMIGNKLYLETELPNTFVITDIMGNSWEKRKCFDLQHIQSPIGKYFSSDILGQKMYIFLKNKPALIKFYPENIKSDWNITLLPQFLYGIIPNNNSAVLRKRNFNTNRLAFYKTDLTVNPSKIIDSLIEKLNTQGILGDGNLEYDESNGLISYMYYYSNIITAFDTNFNMVRHIRTRAFNYNSSKRIDLTEDGNHTQSRQNSRLLLINQTSCINHGIFLLASNLKADNEGSENYQKNIPIDIYNLSTGQYKGSFYLPLKNNSLYRSMKWINDRLITLSHDNTLSVYEFNLPNN